MFISSPLFQESYPKEIIKDVPKDISYVDAHLVLLDRNVQVHK